MKFLYIILSITAFCTNTIFASNDSEYKHRIAIQAALSSMETWKTEVSYHYMLVPYCGVGASLGHWEQMTGEVYPSDKGWHIDEEYEKTSNNYICPSFHFETPPLVRFKSLNLKLFIEPGCQISIPTEKVCIRENSNSSSWDNKYITGKSSNFLDFQLKLCLVLQTKSTYEIGLGYTYSTMDIYSTRRKLGYKGNNIGAMYPAKKDIHEAVLLFCFRF